MTATLAQGPFPGLLALAAGQLLTLGGLALLAFGAGRALTRGLRYASRAEEVALATALGLGLLSSILFLLGLFGGLRAPWLWLAMGLVGGASLAAWRSRSSAGRAAAGSRRLSWPALALLLAVLPAFVLSLYPPMGYDETMYHLPFAQAFARSGALVVLPELRPPVFNVLAELLFTACLALAGDVATHVVQFLALLLIAVALFTMGRRFASRETGVLAGALFLGSPLAHYQAGTAYVDLLLTSFCLAGLYAWEIWNEEGDDRWLVLSAALAGFAAATKYLGLGFVVALAVATAIHRRRQRPWRSLLLFAGVALLALSPSYLRIAWYTGSPLFPFLQPLWEGAMPELGAVVDRSRESGRSAAGEFAAGLLDLLRHPGPLLEMPWRVTFDRLELQRQAPYSPFLLAMLPLAAAGSVLSRRVLRWVVICVAYSLPLARLDHRYLLPAMAVLAVAAATSAHELARRWPGLCRLLGRRGVAAVLAVLVALPGTAYALYKLGKHGRPPASQREREEFLSAALPAYRCLLPLERERVGRYSLYALRGDSLRYYATGRMLGEFLGDPGERGLIPDLRSGEEIRRHLEARGVEYLLVSHLFGKVELPRDEAFSRAFLPLVESEDCALFQLRKASPGP